MPAPAVSVARLTPVERHTCLVGGGFSRLVDGMTGDPELSTAGDVRTQEENAGAVFGHIRD